MPLRDRVKSCAFGANILSMQNQNMQYKWYRILVSRTGFSQPLHKLYMQQVLNSCFPTVTLPKFHFAIKNMVVKPTATWLMAWAHITQRQVALSGIDKENFRTLSYLLRLYCDMLVSF